MFPLQGLTSALFASKFYNSFASLLPLVIMFILAEVYAKDKTVKQVKFVFESLPLFHSVPFSPYSSSY